ncbi:hypothetical protein PG990_012021 [Apiospora arundinis]
MEFTSQAVLGIVGIVVNLPPTILAIWKCWALIRRNRRGMLANKRREPDERLRRLDQSLHLKEPTPAPCEESHVVLMMHLENISSCLGINTWLASGVYGWLDKWAILFVDLLGEPRAELGQRPLQMQRQSLGDLNAVQQATPSAGSLSPVFQVHEQYP